MTTEEDRGLRSSHDEPIVVDNRPVRIDLGPKAVQTGKQWKRPFTSFGYLIVVTLDNDKNNPPTTDVLPLADVAEITFELQGSGQPDAVTFSLGDEQLIMTSRDKKFVKKFGESRIVDEQEATRKLRIVNITCTKTNGTSSHHPIDPDRKKQVFATIAATPETRARAD